MEECKNHIGYEIHTLSKMIGCFLFPGTGSEQEDHLNKMQGWIIRYLYENPDRDIFQKDVENRFHIARSTASGVLGAMEKKGLLTRIPLPSDTRLKKLSLTEKGTEMQWAAVRHIDQMEEILKENISGNDLETFYSVIRQMKKNILNYNQDAPHPDATMLKRRQPSC